MSVSSDEGGRGAKDIDDGGEGEQASKQKQLWNLIDMLRK